MIRLSSASTWPRRAGARAPLARLGSMGAFGLVGLSGIGVNQLLLWALVGLGGMNYLVAAAAASAGSTTANFLLSDRLVFRGRRARGPLTRYVGFLGLTAATMPVRLPLLYLLTSGLHVHYLLSNLVTILAVFLVRYAVSDGLVWGRGGRR